MTEPRTRVVVMKNWRFSVFVAESQSRWSLSGQLAVMSEI